MRAPGVPPPGSATASGEICGVQAYLEAVEGGVDGTNDREGQLYTVSGVGQVRGDESGCCRVDQLQARHVTT